MEISTRLVGNRRRGDNDAAVTATVESMSPIRRSRRAPYILGQEMAQAIAAEDRRLEMADLTDSPMPKGTYDFWRGESSLVDPRPVQLDSELAALVEAFRAADPSSRSAMRRSIDMDGLYTLLAFSKREAVFALRGPSLDRLALGLDAIALIEASRTDQRDILVALSLLHHVAVRLEVQPSAVFAEAASHSEPETAHLIDGFAARRPEDVDLRDAWGYDELVTDEGVGLIRWGFAPYEPTIDLKFVVVDVAALLERDSYQPMEPEIATELPRYWLDASDSKRVDRALGSVRAGAAVSARLRPAASPTHASQRLTVFVAEVDVADAATRLRELATSERAGFSALAVAEGVLFALVVARSFVQKVEAHETTEGLARFEPGLTRILRRHAGVGG